MPLVIDIHTHVYPPAYMEMLRARKTVPYVHDPSNNKDPRLVILSSDDDPSIPIDQRGRPVDSSYWDIEVKLAFMRQHGINCSVISLANPWLDFIEPNEAQMWAERINNNLEETCAGVNKAADIGNTLTLDQKETLFAMGALPLSAPSSDIVVNEIKRLKTLPHLRGVIMGTSGLGKGLDDATLDPVWQALQDTDTLMFLHPHYGLPDEAFGGPDATLDPVWQALQDTDTLMFLHPHYGLPDEAFGGPDATSRYGHVLPLALGFPLETTIAVTRMLLSGVFDRFPRLKILLAHSGGTLPFLAGRIDSCIHHERKFISGGGDVQGPQRSVWDVLKTNIYLDAVVYGKPGLEAAMAASGSDRLFFGTDHPFFPPLDSKEGDWPSVTTNYKAIHATFDTNSEMVAEVLGGNAARILDLK